MSHISTFKLEILLFLIDAIDYKPEKVLYFHLYSL